MRKFGCSSAPPTFRCLILRCDRLRPGVQPKSRCKSEPIVSSSKQFAATHCQIKLSALDPSVLNESFSMTEIYGLLIIEGLELRLSHLRREGGHFEDLSRGVRATARVACPQPAARRADAALTQQGNHPFSAAFSLGCHGKLNRRLMRNRSAARRP
jgi:hypothetical protein